MFFSPFSICASPFAALIPLTKRLPNRGLLFRFVPLRRAIGLVDRSHSGCHVPSSRLTHRFTPDKLTPYCRAALLFPYFSAYFTTP